MRIERIELRLLRLPLVRFFETSFGRVYDRTFLLARIEGEGHEGWGEGVAEANPYYSSETTETAWHVIAEFIAPLVIGVPFSHPGEVFAALARIRGNYMAKAAVEMAVMDAELRGVGLPLGRYLGATKDRRRPSARSVVNASSSVPAKAGNTVPS